MVTLLSTPFPGSQSSWSTCEQRLQGHRHPLGRQEKFEMFSDEKPDVPLNRPESGSLGESFPPVPVHGG